MNVYFDYNATTPLDSAVRQAMLPLLDGVWGNPSSVHRIGREARALLDDARDRVSRVFGCKPSEIVFTSGGTESVNLALFGAARALRQKGRHIVTSSIEHHAVLHSCDYLQRREGFTVTCVPVSPEGVVDLAALSKTIRPDTILVSIMAANNEIGTLQPIEEIARICRQHEVLFHTDAVQWFGKQPFSSIQQFGADLISACAHKIHGPKGVGALYVRSPLRLDPILFGGGHENERRAGTENLAAIVGLVQAIERFVPTPVFGPARLWPMTQRLRSFLAGLPDVRVLGPENERLCNTIAFVVERADSISLLAALDLEGVCASSGAACSAGSLEPSHVVKALGLGDAAANALVRFSLGRDSTLDEVKYIEGVLPNVIRRAQVAQ